MGLTVSHKKTNVKKHYWTKLSDKCRKCPYASYRDNKVIFCGACWKDILSKSNSTDKVKTVKQE